MAKAQTIGIIAVIGIAAFAIWFTFRNFKLPDLGLPELPNVEIPQFPDIGGFFDDIFKTDNSSSIAGETVDFNEDSGKNGGLDGTITIPEDTIVNDDGTVSGSSPLLDLDESTQNKVRSIIEFNAAIAKAGQEKSQQLTQEQLKSINDDIAKLPIADIFDEEGILQRSFTPAAVRTRLINTAIATSGGSFRDKKTGKVLGFGGFDSRLAQEKALRDAIIESQRNNPAAFNAALKKKTKVTA